MSRPHTGRWLEELTPGLVIQHAIRRTITEADNVLFTSITMNPAWIHLDFDYAQRETSYGKPLVNSMLTVAMVVGISVHETTLGTTVANAQTGAYSFNTPALPDGLHNFTVTATDASGNQSPAPAPAALPIDTAPPAAPSTTCPART